MGNNSDRKKGSRIVVIIAVIMILLILVFSVIGALPFFLVKDVMKDAVKTDISKYNVNVTAVIAENLVKTESIGNDMEAKSGDVYTPVYEYEYKGNTYRVTGKVSSSNKKYEVGQQVEIQISNDFPGMMYDPNYNPETAFENFDNTIGKTIVFILIIPVIVMIVLIMVIMIVVGRAKKKADISVYDEEINDDHYDPNDDYRG